MAARLKPDLCEPSSRNAGKGEPKALIGVSHARTCCHGFLLSRGSNLDRARPQPHLRIHKMVLMLHDDFQHLG